MLMKNIDILALLSDLNCNVLDYQDVLLHVLCIDGNNIQIIHLV